MKSFPHDDELVNSFVAKLNINPSKNPHRVLKFLLCKIVDLLIEYEFEMFLDKQRQNETSDKLAYKNGANKKIIHTEIGDITIDIPRCRSHSFEPMLIDKYQHFLKLTTEELLNLLELQNITYDNVLELLTKVYGESMNLEELKQFTEYLICKLSKIIRSIRLKS
ncbi:transposase [Mycoplasma corogypsi]|uniref:transposase n=1 Tax=Mycoplasma corogypsi TaxID=2106 RepID=UPI0038738DBA